MTSDSYIGLSKLTVTVCNCRVSSKKQSADLERQIAFMRERYPDDEIVSDVGSGLNFRRRGLISILERVHTGDSSADQPWDDETEHGSMETEDIVALSSFLSDYTGMPGQYYFAVWDGYGSF